MVLSLAKIPQIFSFTNLWFTSLLVKFFYVTKITIFDLQKSRSLIKCNNSILDILASKKILWNIRDQGFVF